MCGRYTVLTEDEIIEVRSIIKEVSLRLARDDFQEYKAEQHEVAPTNKAPIVTSNGSELAFELGQFGFEKWDGKGVIINARVETVKDKSMFKNRIAHGRCAVPASGYYEWKQPDEGNKKKIKHLIKDKSGNLLFMAGLWRDGKDGREFVVITKEPFGDVINIHDRMPVILRTDQIEGWLSGAMPIEDLAGIEYECFGEPCEGFEDTQDNVDKQMSLFDS
jgi:putative SOS response-associated peptidase YedK